MPHRRDLFRAASLLAGARGRYQLPATGPSVPAPVLPLGQMSVVGMRYQAAATPLFLSKLREGDLLELRREKWNRRDGWAVAVHAPGGERIGYLPRHDNRQVAELLDAGAQLRAEVLEGMPFEVAEGEWRLGAHLSLLGTTPPPAPDERQLEGWEDLLRATPLMAERTIGGSGARAVMLCGPCAGWQRTRNGADWLPPGALPWPSADRIARHYRLRGGEYALAETQRALSEGGLHDLEESSQSPARKAARAEWEARAAEERFCPLLYGWLRTTAYGDAVPGGSSHPLSELRLRLAPPGRNRLDRAGLFDRDGNLVGCIRHNANAMVANMLRAGLPLHAVKGSVCPDRDRGGLTIYYTIVLLGYGTPDAERQRAAQIERLADAVPQNVDAAAHLSTLWPSQLDRVTSEDMRQGAVPHNHMDPELVRWLTNYRRRERGPG